MSVSIKRHAAPAARGPRAWVNRIPVSTAVLAIVTLGVIIAAELIILGR